MSIKEIEFVVKLTKNTAGPDNFTSEIKNLRKI